MISRVADHCFWLGRYIERAESTARVLGVTRNLALDSELLPHQCWSPVLIVSGEERPFIDRHGEAAVGDGEAVQAYMTWADDNHASIVRSIVAARENARSIREVVSLEGWESINELYLYVRSDAARQDYASDRFGYFRHIRQSVQLVHGVVQGTMLHETPLDFMWLGVLLERIGQTARTLDVQHHALTAFEVAGRPGGTSVAAQASRMRRQVIETALWLSLLRACAGFETFMKRNQGLVSGKAVATFLIKEPRFPRSLHYCVHASYLKLCAIRPTEQHGLPGGKVLHRLHALDGWLDQMDLSGIEPEEIHHLLTHVVDETAAICDDLGRELLGHDVHASVPPPPL
jgi:uncharacterized alpha-E superfamily protein